MTELDDRARLQLLKERGDAVVYAKDIAPIVHSKVENIIWKVKHGQWDQDRLGNYYISGVRVKFIRADFVAKWSDRV